MKKIISAFIFILSFLAIFSIAFADDLFEVHFTETPQLISKDQMNKNYHGPFYPISMEFSRNKAEDVYFVVNKQKTSDAGDFHVFPLCKIPGEIGKSDISVKYDGVANSPYDCQDEKILDQNFYEQGYTYYFYITDQRDGTTNISDDPLNSLLTMYDYDMLIDSPQGQNTSGQGNGNQGSNQNQNTHTQGNGNDQENHQNQNSNTGSDIGVGYNQNAGQGLVSTECGYGSIGQFRMCNWNDFMKLINRVVDFIFSLVLPIAAILFVYVGFLLVTSGGNTKKKDDAKRAATNLIIGIVLIMFAWIAIKAILVALGVKAGFILLDF